MPPTSVAPVPGARVPCAGPDVSDTPGRGPVASHLAADQSAAGAARPENGAAPAAATAAAVGAFVQDDGGGG